MSSGRTVRGVNGVRSERRDVQRGECGRLPGIKEAGPKIEGFGGSRFGKKAHAANAAARRT